MFCVCSSFFLVFFFTERTSGFFHPLNWSLKALTGPHLLPSANHSSLGLEGQSLLGLLFAGVCVCVCVRTHMRLCCVCASMCSFVPLPVPVIGGGQPQVSGRCWCRTDSGQVSCIGHTQCESQSGLPGPGKLPFISSLATVYLIAAKNIYIYLYRKSVLLFSVYSVLLLVVVAVEVVRGVVLLIVHTIINMTEFQNL